MSADLYRLTWSSQSSFCFVFTSAFSTPIPWRIPNRQCPEYHYCFCQQQVKRGRSVTSHFLESKNLGSFFHPEAQGKTWRQEPAAATFLPSCPEPCTASAGGQVEVTQHMGQGTAQSLPRLQSRVTVFSPTCPYVHQKSNIFICPILARSYSLILTLLLEVSTQVSKIDLASERLQKNAMVIKLINELPSRPVKMLSSAIPSTESSHSVGCRY